jgi:hypothetical protein
MDEFNTMPLTLSAVRDAALLGITSSEISASTGLTNNRITAALSRLLELRCVRRERIFGMSARHRYWFVRDLDEAKAMTAVEIDVPVTRRAEGFTTPPRPKPRHVDMSGVVIRLNIDGAKAVTVTPTQARKVYNQLRTIFGE